MVSNGQSNGHTNGYHKPLEQSDGHHDRGDAQMRICAIRSRLNQLADDPTSLLDDMKFLRHWAEHGRPMTAATAAKCLIELRLRAMELSVKIDENDDKRRRLDSGESTENTHVTYDVPMPKARVRMED